MSSTTISYPSNEHKRKVDNDESIPPESDIVDDLRFAAQYATNDLITSPNIFNTASTSFYEIKRDANEDESDDESDIDLTQELREMDDEEDEYDKELNNDKSTSKSELMKQTKVHTSSAAAFHPPVTQHEVDIFTCPVTDLQGQLDFDLQVEKNELLMALSNNNMNSSTSTENSSPSVIASSVLISAGYIQHHLVTDRTLVVESTSRRTDNSLLDVGSLLVMLLPQDEGTDDLGPTLLDTSKIRYMDCNYLLLPLGKILEVFGPVGNPLYALRLSPTSTQSTNKCPKNDLQQDCKTNEHHETIDISTDETEEEKYTHNSIESTTNDHKNNDTSSITMEHLQHPKNLHSFMDPWSDKGSMTNWLQSHPKTEVFYFRDQAKIVDTKTVLQNSRKGCDASNIYDEEVNANDLDYSDDEAEMAARHSSKKVQASINMDQPHATSRRHKEKSNYSPRQQQQQMHGHKAFISRPSSFPHQPHWNSTMTMSPPVMSMPQGLPHLYSFPPGSIPYRPPPPPPPPPPMYGSATYPNLSYTPSVGHYPSSGLQNQYHNAPTPFIPPPPPPPPPFSPYAFPPFPNTLASANNSQQPIYSLHPTVPNVSFPTNAPNTNSSQNQSQGKIGDTVYYNYYYK